MVQSLLNVFRLTLNAQGENTSDADCQGKKYEILTWNGVPLF